MLFVSALTVPIRSRVFWGPVLTMTTPSCDGGDSGLPWAAALEGTRLPSLDSLFGKTVEGATPAARPCKTCQVGEVFECDAAERSERSSFVNSTVGSRSGSRFSAAAAVGATPRTGAIPTCCSASDG